MSEEGNINDTDAVLYSSVTEYFDANCPLSLYNKCELACVEPQPRQFPANAQMYSFAKIILNVKVAAIGNHYDFLVDFLTRYPCVGIRIPGICVGSRDIRYTSDSIWSVVWLSPNYDSVLSQFLSCVQCGASLINIPYSPYVIGDVSLHEIDFNKQDRNVVIISNKARLLDIGDIDIELISKIIQFENNDVWRICNNFYHTRNRNQFIDDLLEAGYEEWI